MLPLHKQAHKRDTVDSLHVQLKYWHVRWSTWILPLSRNFGSKEIVPNSVKISAPSSPVLLKKGSTEPKISTAPVIHLSWNWKYMFDDMKK